jgi:CheY-like chemotaxis protein
MLRTTTGAPSEPDQTLSILLIEQGQAMAEAHRARLERDGYSVEHAFGGPAAIERATERPPDLIFLALRLPGILDSVAVLERLRQDVRTRTVPVVILSSESDLELVKDRLNLGELDHLVTEEANVRLPPHPTLLGCAPNLSEHLAGLSSCADSLRRSTLSVRPCWDGREFMGTGAQTATAVSPGGDS